MLRAALCHSIRVDLRRSDGIDLFGAQRRGKRNQLSDNINTALPLIHLPEQPSRSPDFAQSTLFPGPDGESPPPGVYRHYKNGDLYRVMGCVLHTETAETMVLYRALSACARNPLAMSFVRPLKMFAETVMHEGVEVPRFQCQTTEQHHHRK